MISKMPIVYFVFAVLIVGGGIVGTKISHSWHSIAGSLAFGAVAVVCGLLTRRNPKAGLTLGWINALAFICFFIYRFTQTGLLMPAMGPMMLGAIAFALSLIALGQLNRSNA